MKSEGCYNRLYAFCCHGIRILAVLMALGMLALNFVYHITILPGAEDVVFTGNMGNSLATVALTVVLLGLIWRMREPLKRFRCNEKQLFAVCSVLYTIAAIYLILNVDGTLRADAKSVYDTAVAFNKGDYSELRQPGYIARFPYQLGMVLLESLLLSVSPTAKVLFAFNFCLVLLTNYILYRIADLLFRNWRVNVLTILLSFGFLPHFFFILFAYGLIPALSTMMAAFYFALKFDRQGKKRFLVWMAFFCAMSVILKKNFLIGVMAICLYLVIRWLQNRQLQKAAAIILLVLCMVFPVECLNRSYEKKADVELTGAPSVLWIAMGIDIENKMRAPGWFDGTVWDIYTACEFDTDRAAAAGKEKLLFCFEKMAKYPRATVAFFVKKTISQWCDPLYQSIWSGPQTASDQYTHTDLTRSLYEAGPAYQHVMMYAKSFSLVLWFLVAFFLIAYGGKTEGWEMFAMFSMGGAIFHTVWEGKSQYIMPYVIVLIPFAAYALYRICVWDGISRIGSFLGKKSKEQ